MKNGGGLPFNTEKNWLNAIFRQYVMPTAGKKRGGFLNAW
jgi:hypothetical protein